jgi:Icc-related predicted phosphoesterase
MKLLVLADIDDFHWQGGSGRADVLLALGDMADAVILQAAKDWHCPTVLAVKGNHDTDTPFQAPIIDLHLRTIELGGFSFGGLNGCWQYKPHGFFLYEQEEIEAYLQTFPAVDIFLTHNSPRWVHDREDEIHTGFSGLNNYIERTAPRLLLHGHQHQNCETLVNRTHVIGVFGWQVIEI